MVYFGKSDNVIIISEKVYESNTYNGSDICIFLFKEEQLQIILFFKFSYISEIKEILNKERNVTTKLVVSV